MRIRVLGLIVLGVLMWYPISAAAPNEAKATSGTVLDTFHRAASEADGDL